MVQTIPEVFVYFGSIFVNVHTRSEGKVHGEGAFCTTRPMASCHRVHRMSVTPSAWNLLQPHDSVFCESTFLLLVASVKTSKAKVEELGMSAWGR